jgi:hypothetical protein
MWARGHDVLGGRVLVCRHRHRWIVSSVVVSFRPASEVAFGFVGPRPNWSS